MLATIIQRKSIQGTDTKLIEGSIYVISDKDLALLGVVRQGIFTGLKFPKKEIDNIVSLLEGIKGEI